MAGKSRARDANDPDDAPIPVWLKAMGAAALLMLLLVVIAHLTGLSPVGHGP